jgi:hypothetical protein
MARIELFGSAAPGGDGVPTGRTLDDLLGPRELARRLRCAERTLERRRELGDGPPYCKIGGLIRYRLSEVDAWLTSISRRSTSEAGAGSALSAGAKPERKTAEPAERVLVAPPIP